MHNFQEVKKKKKAKHYFRNLYHHKLLIQYQMPSVSASPKKGCFEARAEVIAHTHTHTVYLDVNDQPVPPVSRCWFGAARSVGIHHDQNILVFLQKRGERFTCYYF